ncbi:hypothetical protein DSO57_1023900 [Entomophthora muscae]|uniref:Uncharacterized protein n=1 Tax=Entomophthora muscae TaxID=34485 RepID=A0ACC2SFJ5_9FUNG|nr:hypothetical protein DSO57_1023900 [Entomophthora muscae]
MHTEHLYFAGVYYIITNFILLVLSNREYLQYQRQRWEKEQLLAASNQPLPAFTPSPRVLDQEIILAPALRPSFPGVPLLQQLAQPSLTMSATTEELSLVPSASSYGYSKLGFAYLTMLGLIEQVIPHMEVWRPWDTAANYVIGMAPVIYWAFPSTEGSPGSHPGHDRGVEINRLRIKIFYWIESIKLLRWFSKFMLLKGFWVHLDEITSLGLVFSSLTDTTRVAVAQKRTIAAFAVIVSSTLPCNLLLDSPGAGKSKITKKEEHLQKGVEGNNSERIFSEKIPSRSDAALDN